MFIKEEVYQEFNPEELGQKHELMHSKTGLRLKDYGLEGKYLNDNLWRLGRQIFDVIFPL